MNTTEIHIEHFMSGVLSLLFLLIMAAACMPIEPASLQFVFAHETIASIVAMSIAYPLAIFSDNIADSLLEPYEDILRKKECNGEKISISSILVEMNDDFIRSYFNYNRVRIRIARATWFNFLLIFLSIGLFYLLRVEYLQENGLLLHVYCSMAFTFLISVYALMNWQMITRQNFKKLYKLKSNLSSGLKQS
jgi:hypothetical protein